MRAHDPSRRRRVSIPSLSGLRVIIFLTCKRIADRFQSPLYRVSESLKREKDDTDSNCFNPLFIGSPSHFTRILTANPIPVSIPSLSGLRVIHKMKATTAGYWFQSPLYRVSESLPSSCHYRCAGRSFNPLFIGSPSHCSPEAEEEAQAVSIPSLSGLRVICTERPLNNGSWRFNPLFIGSPSHWMELPHIATHRRFQSPLYRVSESLPIVAARGIWSRRFNPLFIGSPSHCWKWDNRYQLVNVSIPSLSGLRVITNRDC